MSRIFILQALLAISLAFNAAVAFMYCTHTPPSPPHMPDDFVERMQHRLSPADASTVREVFESHRKQFEAARKVIDADYADVHQALGAVPFDPDRVRMAMEKAHEARSESDEIFQATIIEAASKLSPEERDKLLPPLRNDHDRDHNKP